MLRNELPQQLSSTAANPGWAAMASTTSNATGAHAPTDAIVGYLGRLYLPVSHDLARLLSLDTADAEEVESAFAEAARDKREAGPGSAPSRLRRYDAHTPAGMQHFFHHHARGAVIGIANEHRDELMRLSRGEITIAAGDAALHTVVRTIPAGILEEDRQPFKGWYVRRRPTTWHCVYPPVAGGRNIAFVTQFQADGSRTPVLVAMHENRHSYSVDRGRTWTPTGAIHSQDAQNARAGAWSRFFANRRARADALQSQANQGHGG